MKFGIRECANIVFRAKQNVQIGDTEFAVGQPVLYIDSATTSTLEQAATTVYAQGGRGNSRLIAWEGDKTLTFTVEDALLSPMGFSILSGAGLFKGYKSDPEAATPDKVHFHMTSNAAANASGVIDLTDAVAEFGAGAEICADDAPLYVLGIESDGSISGTVYTGATVSEDGKKITCLQAASQNVMVDYYVDVAGDKVYEADITADTFAGYYYVEADTLFRKQENGKDMPANLTFPNVKIQSNFSIAMSGSGDPSTFSFTMDAFPGYTYFDKTKKVLCVLQIADTNTVEKPGKPVMLHDSVDESNGIINEDSISYNDRPSVITVEDDTLTVASGSTVAIVATSSDGSAITYTSSDTTKASVNASTGVVSGLNAGEVTINLTNATGGSATVTVTVTQ